MHIKFLFVSLFLFCVLASANAQQASVPTEELYVMNQQHVNDLAASHDAMIAKLQADGITVITQDTKLSVEKETKVAFDWSVSSGQNLDFTKVPRDIRVFTLYPATTQDEQGGFKTVPQLWNIEYATGTISAEVNN